MESSHSSLCHDIYILLIDKIISDKLPIRHLRLVCKSWREYIDKHILKHGMKLIEIYGLSRKVYDNIEVYMEYIKISIHFEDASVQQSLIIKRWLKHIFIRCCFWRACDFIYDLNKEIEKSCTIFYSTRMRCTLNWVTMYDDNIFLCAILKRWDENWKCDTSEEAIPPDSDED